MFHSRHGDFDLIETLCISTLAGAAIGVFAAALFIIPHVVLWVAKFL